MKKSLVFIMIFGVSLTEVARAGWTSSVISIAEHLVKAFDAKMVKIVDDVPKHAPEGHFSVAPQVGRLITRCIDRDTSDDWRRKCEKMGAEFETCLTSESNSGSSIEQAEKKCSQIIKK